MFFIYNILVTLAGGFLKLAALFNPKLKLFTEGRKHVFATLKEHILPADKVIWFHTASLGEFEQGLPVMEKIRQDHPSHKIVLSFFSPSGYEVKKNTTAADVVVYLPMDTKANALRFLELLHPEMAVFVKYEFWPNYLNELKKRKVHTLLISGIFRKNQVFFGPFGGFMRNALQAFNHFFLQDEISAKLLSSLGFENYSVTGDTRLDRVLQILERDNTLPFMETFKGTHLCVVVGSSWPEDEAVLVPYINNQTSNKVRFVIAPHNMKVQHIVSLKESLTKKTVLYSEMKGKDLSDFEVFIIDTIGLLTKIYSYADIAYVGGGMGNTGLHNTLEPAVFGIPVIIGKNYKKFKEARELMEKGGLFSIENGNSYAQIMDKLTENSTYRKQQGLLNSEYIIQNKGASDKICYHISNHL